MRTMMIYLKDRGLLITVAEGTGDNLTDEDIADGYIDYVMTNLYEQNGYELTEIDGGQMLSQRVIANMDRDELANRLLDYWDYSGEKNYQVME